MAIARSGGAAVDSPGLTGNTQPMRQAATSAGPARSATLLAVGSILLWCWSGVCFTMGGRLLGPGVYLTFMTAVGSITVLVLQAVRRRPLSELLLLPPRVMLAGFFGVALYTVMLALAFGIADEADLGQVNLLNYLWPIWIVLLSLALLDERLRKAPVLAGALLGFAGVFISRGTEGLLQAPEDWRPHLLSLSGAFLWALYCVLLRRWRIPEEQGGTAFHFAVCAVLAALLAAGRGEWTPPSAVSGEAVFWVLFGGIGPVGLAYHWWEIGMKRGSVHLLSLLAYFIPLGSSVLIGLFFARAMNPGLLPGAALITAGAWLAGKGLEGAKRSPAGNR